jgi:hypothetical protein
MKGEGGEGKSLKLPLQKLNTQLPELHAKFWAEGMLSEDRYE